jgi:large subunit ribosomal protein L25
MSAMLSLTVEKRPTGENSPKADILRKAGKMPAVFYGPKEKSTPVVVSHVDFLKVWKKAGESSVIILKDGSDEHEALIHDIDFDPITDVPRHADFYVIEKGKKVKVAVHLSFDGTAPAVKDLGGILIKVLHEVKIEAAPKDLPHELHVDISALTDLTSTIHAKDIKLPAGVILVTDKDEVVASIAQAKEEPVEAPTAVDMTQIEVEKKGKEAKEGEEAPAGDAAKEAAPKEAKK